MKNVSCQSQLSMILYRIILSVNRISIMLSSFFSTLVCGGAGSGKTLLAMAFIVRGVTDFNEPGVYMVLEEHGETTMSESKHRSKASPCLSSPCLK